MSEEKIIFEQEVLQRMSENYRRLFPAERRVADTVLKDPMKIVSMNVSELAKASEVSDATVIRVCQRLGYDGYHQFRLTLAGDLGKKESRTSGPQITELPDNAIAKEFEKFAKEMIAIGQHLDMETIRACIELIKNAGMVHIIGMGNTTNITRYMGFRMERLGIRCTYSELPEYYINHINLAKEDEIVIAVTKSGSSKRVLDSLKLAKNMGLKIILISEHADTAAAKYADHVLLSTGSKNPFDMSRGYSYLNEMAVIEALLNFTVNEELINERKSIRPELLLAENKL